MDVSVDSKYLRVNIKKESTKNENLFGYDIAYYTISENATPINDAELIK